MDDPLTAGIGRIQVYEKITERASLKKARTFFSEFTEHIRRRFVKHQHAAETFVPPQHVCLFHQLLDGYVVALLHIRFQPDRIAQTQVSFRQGNIFAAVPDLISVDKDMVQPSFFDQTKNIFVGGRHIPPADPECSHVRSALRLIKYLFPVQPLSTG